eukprot:COSAG03_NODE_413_length_8134_cov_3.448164_9_plen_434_part_00
MDRKGKVDLSMRLATTPYALHGLERLMCAQSVCSGSKRCASRRHAVTQLNEHRRISSLVAAATDQLHRTPPCSTQRRRRRRTVHVRCRCAPLMRCAGWPGMCRPRRREPARPPRQRVPSGRVARARMVRRTTPRARAGDPRVHCDAARFRQHSCLTEGSRRRRVGACARPAQVRSPSRARSTSAVRGMSRPSLHASFREEVEAGDAFGRTVSEQQHDDPLYRQRSASRQGRPVWQDERSFLLAAVGAAIGTGNVWRFPYLCFKYGGGSFLVPYFFSVFVLGIPVMVLELGLGQQRQKGFVYTMHEIHPALAGLAWATVLNTFLSCVFYCMVMAWSLIYLLHSFSEPWAAAEPPQSNAADPLESAAGLWWLPAPTTLYQDPCDIPARSPQVRYLWLICMAVCPSVNSLVTPRSPSLSLSLSLCLCLSLSVSACL